SPPRGRPTPRAPRAGAFVSRAPPPLSSPPPPSRPCPGTGPLPAAPPPPAAAAARDPRRLSTNHDSTDGPGRQRSFLINAPRPNREKQRLRVPASRGAGHGARQRVPGGPGQAMGVNRISWLSPAAANRSSRCASSPIASRSRDRPRPDHSPLPPRAPAGPGEPPYTADEPVEEHRPGEDAVAAVKPQPVVVADHAGAVGVRQDQVVELGDQAHRCRGVRAGPWRVRQ